MKRNSIMQTEKKCYVCGKQTNLHLHHCIFGQSRKKCDEDKLTVWLCYDHHEGTNGVHGKNGHELDSQLKREAELVWCRHYGKTKEDFLKRYGRNYL